MSAPDTWVRVPAGPNTAEFMQNGDAAYLEFDCLGLQVDYIPESGTFKGKRVNARITAIFSDGRVSVAVRYPYSVRHRETTMDRLRTREK